MFCVAFVLCFISKATRLSAVNFMLSCWIVGVRIFVSFKFCLRTKENFLFVCLFTRLSLTPDIT